MTDVVSCFYMHEPHLTPEKIAQWEADMARDEKLLKEQGENVAAFAQLPEAIRDALRTKHSVERHLARKEKLLRWRTLFRKR